MDVYFGTISSTERTPKAVPRYQRIDKSHLGDGRSDEYRISPHDLSYALVYVWDPFRPAVHLLNMTLEDKKKIDDLCRLHPTRREQARKYHGPNVSSNRATWCRAPESTGTTK